MRHDPRRLDPAAYPWTVEVATRFGDMDINFHLNNIAVAGLYEEARVRFHLHLGQRVPELRQMRLVVARVGIDYLAEGRYPAAAQVGVAVSAIGTSSYTLALALFQDARCIGLSDAVLVLRGGRGTAPIPDTLRTVLGELAAHA